MEVNVNVDQNVDTVGAVSTLGKVVAAGIGCVCAGYVGTILNGVLPAAVSTVEKIGRTVMIGGASIATQKVVSDAIASDVDEILGVASQASLKRQAKLLAAQEASKKTK